MSTPAPEEQQKRITKPMAEMTTEESQQTVDAARKELAALWRKFTIQDGPEPRLTTEDIFELFGYSRQIDTHLSRREQEHQAEIASLEPKYREYTKACVDGWHKHYSEKIGKAVQFIDAMTCEPQGGLKHCRCVAAIRELLSRAPSSPNDQKA